MKVVKEIEQIRGFIKNGLDIRYCSFQNIDFTSLDIHWAAAEIKSTYFLGCQLNADDVITLIEKGAYVFQSIPELPFNPFRQDLYTPEELMSIQDNLKAKDSYDKYIYDHFVTSRYNPDVAEALWQRIHDHAMDDALREKIGMRNDGDMDKKVVAFMGGHAMLRKDENFEKVVFLAKELATKGYFIATGGGPGIMEAANLGAYMSTYSNYETKMALDIIQKAQSYTDDGYLEAAQEVKDRYPEGAESLAIPTWFYGHEPSNLFSSHIAKYFSNSIREDTLLSIALHGIVFAPGSAGTFQEIFMDAAQNHYGTFRFISPMVFLNKQFYEEETFIYPMLKRISAGKKYHDMIFVSDEVEEIIRFIEENPKIDQSK